jgi:hypothetical protein
MMIDEARRAAAAKAPQATYRTSAIWWHVQMENKTRDTR